VAVNEDWYKGEAGAFNITRDVGGSEAVRFGSGRLELDTA